MRLVHYATYFDRHYVTRGVALYRSLERHSPPFLLWVLCLDDETRRLLASLQLEHVRLVPLAELERADPALLEVRNQRLPLEYYWTCGPAFLRYLFQHHPQIELLSYLDADLFFFHDPTPVFEALGAQSILLIEQRFSAFEPTKPRGGLYNVGLVVFRRTASAIACLERWRAQCLDWCFDRFEPDRHGDQKYLDDWPNRFDVAVLPHKGAGIAPWNVRFQQIGYEGGRVLIERDPLIYYHFARVHRINRWVYEMHDSRFHREPAHPLVRRRIYAPYLRELYAAERQVRAKGGRIPAGTARVSTPGEVFRRSRAADVTRTNPTQYLRFMFVCRSFAL